MRTRLALSSGIVIGVTTLTGTPAMVENSIFTGYTARVASEDICLDWLCWGFLGGGGGGSSCDAEWAPSRARAACASGLTVSGTGTIRVMYAVPCLSM